MPLADCGEEALLPAGAEFIWSWTVPFLMAAAEPSPPAGSTRWRVLMLSRYTSEVRQVGVQPKLFLYLISTPGLYLA